MSYFGRNNWSRPLFLAPRCRFFPTDRLFGDNGTPDSKLTSEKDIDLKHQWRNMEKRRRSILKQRQKKPALYQVWRTAGRRDGSNLARDRSIRLQFLGRCAAWFLIHCQHHTQSILFRWHSAIFSMHLISCNPCSASWFEDPLCSKCFYFTN